MGTCPNSCNCKDPIMSKDHPNGFCTVFKKNCSDLVDSNCPRQKTKCVCREYLAAMVGLYEEDAIEATFGAGMCELDCGTDICPKNHLDKFIVIGGSR